MSREWKPGQPIPAEFSGMPVTFAWNDVALTTLLQTLEDGYWSGYTSMCDHVREAMHNFTPPRMDEPGTWGVVEASCVHSDERREWMRHRDGNWYVVGTDTKNNPDDWDSLIDPALVREGVTS